MNVVKTFSVLIVGTLSCPVSLMWIGNVRTMFLLMFDKCWIILFQKLKHFIFRLYHLHYFNIITIILETIKDFWTLLVLRTLRSMWRSNKFAQHLENVLAVDQFIAIADIISWFLVFFFNNIIFLFSRYVLWVGLLFWQHSVKTHFKQVIEYIINISCHKLLKKKKHKSVYQIYFFMKFRFF